MTSETDREEDRLRSVFQLLFAINSAGIVYFLVAVPWVTLPLTLPFTLASFPFNTQVATFAALAGLSVIYFVLNLFHHGKRGFQRSMKVVAAMLTISTFAVFAWGWISLVKHPEYLLHELQ